MLEATVNPVLGVNFVRMTVYDVDVYQPQTQSVLPPARKNTWFLDSL